MALIYVHALTTKWNLSTYNVEQFLHIMSENSSFFGANAHTSFQLFCHDFKMLCDECFTISDLKEYKKKPWQSSGLKTQFKGITAVHENSGKTISIKNKEK